MRPLGIMVLGALLLGTILGQGDALATRQYLRKQTKGVTIVDRLGKTIDLDLRFTDHNNKSVRLGDYFGGKPVLLTLNYYRCKTLCTVQLNQLVRGLKGLGWKPGGKYRMVTVSIDPRESYDLGAAKRETYLRSLGMGQADWSFLVGKADQIEKLADQVGFKYRYDKTHDQYIHVPAVFFVSPKGKLTLYLHGLKYQSRSLKFALMEASGGKIGSVKDKLFMSCFHYNPKTGTYSASAFGIMRLAASTLAVLLFIMLALLFTLDRFVWSKQNKGETS